MHIHSQIRFIILQIWRWVLTHNDVQCWGDRVIWANCGVAYTVSRTCFKNTFHGSGVQKWPKSISHNSLWRLTYEYYTFIFNFGGIRGQLQSNLQLWTLTKHHKPMEFLVFSALVRIRKFFRSWNDCSWSIAGHCYIERWDFRWVQPSFCLLYAVW